MYNLQFISLLFLQNGWKITTFFQKWWKQSPCGGLIINKPLHVVLIILRSCDQIWLVIHANEAWRNQCYNMDHKPLPNLLNSSKWRGNIKSAFEPRVAYQASAYLQFPQHEVTRSICFYFPLDESVQVTNKSLFSTIPICTPGWIDRGTVKLKHLAWEENTITPAKPGLEPRSLDLEYSGALAIRSSQLPKGKYTEVIYRTKNEDPHNILLNMMINGNNVLFPKH